MTRFCVSANFLLVDFENLTVMVSPLEYMASPESGSLAVIDVIRGATAANGVSEILTDSERDREYAFVYLRIRLLVASVIQRFPAESNVVPLGKFIELAETDPP